MTLVFVALFASHVTADDSCPGLPTCFCNAAKTSVNCDGKHFTEIPTTIPKTVTSLYLRYNLITDIKTGAFASLSDLQKVWLNKNAISNIEEGGFQNLTNLKYLDLSGNRISSIVSRAFSGMPNVETIFLNTNKLKTVSDTAFVGADSLKSLYLQSNDLPSIPPLCDLPSLTKLVLQGNSLVNATFPECFRNNSKISYLVLSQNGISELNNHTFAALTNASISTLYISDNKLTQTSTGVFTPLRSIASLKIGSNPLGPAALKMAIESLRGKDMVSLDLSSLSHFRGGLLADTFALLRNSSITTLNMGGNNIPSLPNNVFTGLNKLLHLDLSNCKLQLTNVSSFKGLDKLTILNLQKNRLTDIPKYLPRTLDKLNMDDNQVTVIPNRAFANLTLLTELRFSYNRIQNLMEDSFLGLSNLQKLTLYGNQIATLPGSTFAPLVRLKSLTLAKNHLTTIQVFKTRFFSLTSLFYLNMADNNCFSLPLGFFEDLMSLQYLHLEGNDLGGIIGQDYGGDLFKSLRNLKELYLMGNRIANLPDATFHNLVNLVWLNASKNQITGWEKDLFRSTSKLEMVDMSRNQIANLKPETLKFLPKSMKVMNLSGNPFTCDCSLRDFRDWINQTSIVLADNASYACNGPNEWKNKPLLTFDRSKINCLFFTKWQIILSAVVGAVFVSVIGIVVYRKRWWIKLFIYKQTRAKKVRKIRAEDGRGNYGAIDQEEDGLYDAYISCAPDDSDWVIRNLLPGIDKGQLGEDERFGGEFSLYFEERDSQPGKFVCLRHYYKQVFMYLNGVTMLYTTILRSHWMCVFSFFQTNRFTYHCILS